MASSVTSRLAVKFMNDRLDGLDLARFFAFVGMVIVNFKVVMVAINAEPASAGFAAVISGALEGRAAATFVVLAGVGLGLATTRYSIKQVRMTTLRRALFLLVIGLANCLIFEADILHFYAVYFLLAIPLLGLASIQLVLIIFALTIAFPLMVIVFNYDAGWNWNNYSYTDFWTINGFFRNLFFNGWHPVVPWLGYLLFGMVLSRLALAEKSVQRWLMIIGVLAMVVAAMIEHTLGPTFAQVDTELETFLTTDPVPPMPLYIVSGIGASMIVIGFCLYSTSVFRRTGLLQIIAPAGRQALSLYVAHIVLGMGKLESFDLLGNQTAATALLAAVLFSAIALIYSWSWSRFFKRGPLEYLMRSTAG